MLQCRLFGKEDYAVEPANLAPKRLSTDYGVFLGATLLVVFFGSEWVIRHNACQPRGC